MNNKWKYWGDFVELKGNSNLVMNILKRGWSPLDNVIAELFSKIKRFRKEEKIRIKFTWVSRDMKHKQ